MNREAARESLPQKKPSKTYPGKDQAGRARDHIVHWLVLPYA